MKSFHNSTQYCNHCDKAYDHHHEHRCPVRCNVCFSEECFTDEPVVCPDCNRKCKSRECFLRHQESGRKESSFCEQYYECLRCGKFLQSKIRNPQQHRCGEIYCAGCKKFFQPGDHFCYLDREKAKKKSDNLIFFDFETDQSTSEHIVNFAVAQYADGTEKVFPGYTALNDFCRWLFDNKHKDFTAVAHSMSGFDGQFVLR